MRGDVLNFDTATGSGAAPHVDEAARIDLAVREATTGPWAQAHWTGRDLLLEGISHGATAPVILMARTALDDQSHWHGSHFTAGCFFDGSYDPVATANLLKTGAPGGTPCTFPVSYTRGLERDCGPGATGATSDLSSNVKAQEDNVTGVPPETFSVADFILPGAPVQRLCQRLDQSPTHTRSFTPLPNDGHLTWHANAYEQCRTWFEGILPP